MNYRGTHAYNRGLAEGRHAQSQDDQQRRDAFRRQDMEGRIGRPLIVVPNEWINPVIGFGESLQAVGDSTILIIKNYISMEDVWCGGVVMDFSEQRLDVALSLDPYQLWAITAHNAVGHEDFDKPRSGVRWDRKTILDALETNGFFHRWQQYRHENRMASGKETGMSTTLQSGEGSILEG